MCLTAVIESLRDICTAVVSNFSPWQITPRKSVDDQLILITGAGGDLGRRIAVRLAREGARLVLWDVNEDENARTKSLCCDIGAEVMAKVVDLADRKSIYSAAEIVRNEMGKVDIVINNAGILRSGGPFLEKDDSWIERTVDVNMMAHIWMAKAFLPEMINRGTGHIVCICSLSGIVGAHDIVDYSASKFGANGFQEALENEMAKQGNDGIKFTTICPSYISTVMLDHIPTLKKDQSRLDADSVANEIVDSILREKKIVLLPKSAYFLYALKGLLPRRVFQRILLKEMTR